jgi:mono/diheme cytochrome c family protein/glucose/arabinose dehydrogenase
MSDMKLKLSLSALIMGIALLMPQVNGADQISLNKGKRIILIGNNLGSRMLNYGHFETEMQVRYPELQLYIRNMCDGGNTPGFRPHSARKNSQHWAFPGAEKFNPNHTRGSGSGHNETPDQWITRHKADVIIALFGAVKAFEGKAGLANFTAELDAFVKHTLSQKYNGKTAPMLALVSPIAFQDLSATKNVPNGLLQNVNMQIYSEAMRQVAAKNNVVFVDAFTSSKRWFDNTKEALTIDGSQLNDKGYQMLAPLLADGVFGKASAKTESNRKMVHAAVEEKNWLWHNDFKIPNGVHTYGRRYKPFGPANYPTEFIKIREMADVRDQAIWAASMGKKFDLKAADAKTSGLAKVKTNFRGKTTYQIPKDATKTLQIADGYKVELFASETEFPNLANPMQMSFDNKGRLWVAVMPSYPHWLPGDPRPTDKLLIYEDTNNDGKADKETVFAGDLNIPIGFEFAPEGVYVSQGTNLVLLKDLDGDDKYDTKEIILSGFDDHDTHHNIGAFCTDPSGAIFMGEGTFLNTSVETSYGTVRGTNGGFYRYSPQRHRLERALQVSIPNPWGIAFDHWGQGFFLHTSGPSFCWMTPYRIKPQYGHSMRTKDLLTSEKARPTSGLEFISSRHFPDEVQGDAILCNNIGYQGIKQHQMIEEGTGYTTKFRQNLLVSKDRNFRPVDLEFAPDGSLYVVDWHNVLVGHMQHNARDPHRDHTHGRVYRITCNGRPLVKPAKIDGASVTQLLENLKLPEYRSRYRSRRELRARKASEVLPELTKWVAGLDKSDKKYDHHVLEALWTTWGLDKVDEKLLGYCLKSTDYRVRSAAVNVLHYNPQLKSQKELLVNAAQDQHGRVRLEAISAASWVGKSKGLAILDAAKNFKPSKTAAVKPVMSNKLKMKNNMFHAKLKGEKVSKIEIKHRGRKTINLAEIEIYSGGKNIAKQAKASISSKYNDTMDIDKMVDGNKKTIAHTKDKNRHPYMRFEFATAVSIDEVKIWNRDSYQDRINGATLTFLNGKKAVKSMTFEVKGGAGSSTPGMDSWMGDAYNTALKNLNGERITAPPAAKIVTHLKGTDRELFVKGKEIFHREGHCVTCHQEDGNGLESSGFPPLAGTKWAIGSEERLIMLTIKGIMGPIEVKGKKYPGQVPMTPFGGMLEDDSIAAVLTYVRNSFGNKASVVTPAKVKAVRAKIKSKVGFYTPEELLKVYPHK